MLSNAKELGVAAGITRLSGGSPRGGAVKEVKKNVSSSSSSRSANLVMVEERKD